MSQDINTVITSLNAAWNADFNAGNAALVASHYDQQAALLPPGGAQVTGAAEIEAFWLGLITGGFHNHTIESIEVIAAEGMVSQRAKWGAQGKNPDGTIQDYSGNLLVVFRQQADGGWKALNHVWN